VEKRQITVKSEGDFAVLAFFSVVASSQILPQCYKYNLISVCKGNMFFCDKQKRLLFFDFVKPYITLIHNRIFCLWNSKIPVRFPLKEMDRDFDFAVFQALFHIAFLTLTSLVSCSIIFSPFSFYLRLAS